MDIADRLGSSLDALVSNCGPIRERFQEIENQLSDDLVDLLSPAMFLKQHQLKLQRTQKKIADRFERQSLEATIHVSRQQVTVDKAKLDKLTAGPDQTQKMLDELK